MKYSLVLGDWTALQVDAQAVRFDVFVAEQGVAVELELDENDPVCLHAVVYDAAGRAIGTGRLLQDGHIGRMAVRKSARNAGIGSRILESLICEAQKRGHDAVVLNAQTQAVDFYARFGFVREGDEFDDAGIAHVAMTRVF